MTSPMNGTTSRRLWALACAAFIIGVIVFLPAHFFEDRINRALPPPLHLVVSGTVWDGIGVLQNGRADVFAIPLTWKFDPLALARARLTWKIVPDSRSFSGSIKVGAGWQSVEFREAALTMDAEIFQQLVPLLAILAPSGNVIVSTPPEAGLTVNYGNELRLNGEANIQANNFGLRPYGPQPLGSYQLKFTARDTNVDYIVGQSGGALKLEGGGSIQMAAPRQITYAGHATASPALHEALLAQLKAQGPAGADGRIRIDWKARW